MDENYFSERRSCRNFTSTPIDDSKLEKIIKLAMKAPTCGNMQLYSVVVTRDSENKRKLAEFHYNQPAATSCSVILTVCADFYRFTRWCEINNADAGYQNFHSFLLATTDAVILAQQITTIAEQMGIATCYLGTVTYNAEEISELLQLPKLVVPVASLALGVAACEGEKTLRLPVSGILHKEKYPSLTDQEIIDIFKIHDENPENAKYLEENGKENLASVFAEVRYPKAVNEEISKKFLKHLDKKDFISK